MADIQLWREDGPSDNPTWTELPIDANTKTLDELGLRDGDVVVVQEHTRRLDSNQLSAPHFFRQQLNAAAASREPNSTDGCS